MICIEITVQVKENNAAFYTDDTGRATLELRNVWGALGAVSTDMMDALIAGAREDHREKKARGTDDDAD